MVPALALLVAAALAAAEPSHHSGAAAAFKRWRAARFGPALAPRRLKVLHACAAGLAAAQSVEKTEAATQQTTN